MTATWKCETGQSLFLNSAIVESPPQGLFYSFPLHIRDLMQQDGWKTQDSSATKKCRARPEMYSLARNFFVIV